MPNVIANGADCNTINVLYNIEKCFCQTLKQALHNKVYILYK